MSEKRISNREYVVAIAFALLSALSLAVTNLFAKQLTSATGIYLAVFLRFFAPFLLAAWITLAFMKQRPSFSDWPVHLLRSVFTFGAQLCLFLYLVQGSVLMGTLLFSTSGLFLPFITYVLFGVEIRRRHLLAIAVSFVGVAIALNPVVDFHWIMAIGLLAGLLNAGTQASMHHLSKEVDALSASTIMFGICSLFGVCLLIGLGDINALMRLASFERLSAGHLFAILVLFSIASMSNQAFRSKAFQIVRKPSSITPFLFVSIVFAGGLDWWVYGIVPAPNVYAGTALIVGGGLIMTHRSLPPNDSEASPKAG